MMWNFEKEQSSTRALLLLQTNPNTATDLRPPHNPDRIFPRPGKRL